jgi:hypothetical protein
MCQGEQRRLAHLGHPKHLLEIGGETILGRTLRLVSELAWNTTRQPLVIGPARLAEVAALHGAQQLELNKPGYCILDGICATIHRWLEGAAGQRVTILLGDVVWSRPALEALLGDRRELVFAGTTNVSTSNGEIFGFSFTDQLKVADLLRTAPCRLKSGRRSEPIRYSQPQGGHLRRLLWHAMQRKQLLPVVSQHTWHPSLYLPTDDWTDDIDTPADVARLPELELEVLAERAMLRSARVATPTGSTKR